MIRSENEIREKIKQIREKEGYLLEGEFSTIDINAPRALMQISVENRLEVLYWALGEEYISPFTRRKAKQE